MLNLKKKVFFMLFVNSLKKLVLMTCLVLVGQGFAEWDGVSTEKPSMEYIYKEDGQTIKDSIYLIRNENQLAWFAAQVNKVDKNGKITNGGKVGINAKLMADLDMIGPDGERRLWTPIGAGDNKNNFKGTFDGNKHVISNVYISAEELIQKYGNDKSAAQNVGFIGCFSGTVKDLILENIEVLGYGRGGITDSGDPVDKPISIGTIVGWQSGNGSLIDGCSASGVVVTSGDGQAVGGIVGNIGAGKATNCMSTVSIKASGLAYVGGIAGYTKSFGGGSVTVSSCVYAGTELSAEGSLEYGGKTYHSAAGAIVGHQYKGTVTFDDLYYDSDLFGADGGVGATTSGGSTTGSTTGVPDVNSVEVICPLNGGEIVDGECSKDSPWSVGENTVSLYGSDGFTITFNAKSGAFPDGAKKKKVILKDRIITPEEISAPVCVASCIDSVFAGWSLNPIATEPDDDLGSVSGAATVYAVWYPIYTITFSAAPGKYADGTTVTTVKVAKGDMISVTGMEVPTTYVKNGITLYFTGWSDEQKEFEADDDITDSDTLHLDGLIATGNTTFYAAWTKAETYTVTYNANGHGKTKVDFVNVTKGQTLTEPPAPTPDDGYEYTGWCLNASACNINTHFDFETPIDRNYTLYADWNAKAYTITYNLNGGTNNKDNPATYTIESETIVFQSPVRSGYNFKGWFYDENFTESAKQITAGSTGNKVIYAKWEEKIYEVAYMAGSGGAVGSISPAIKRHGESITLAEGGYYTLEGYAQDGWATSDGGNRVYALEDTYAADADITLYPHWVEENVVVSYYGAVTIYTYPDTHKEAVVSGNYAGDEAVEIPEDIEVTSVTLERTFNNTASTLILPFDIAVENVNGARFYNLDGIDINEETGRRVVHFKREKSLIHAHTPYGIRPAVDFEGETYSITFNGPVTIKSTVDIDPVVTVEGQGRFTGAYANMTVSAEESGLYYGFAGKNVEGVPTGTFVRLGTGAKIPVLRGYIVNLATNRARSLTATPTSAKNISSLKTNVYDTEWSEEEDVLPEEEEQTLVLKKQPLNVQVKQMNRVYDLKGRLMNGKRASKGLYLDKKVIVK